MEPTGGLGGIMYEVHMTVSNIERYISFQPQVPDALYTTLEEGSSTATLNGYTLLGTRFRPPRDHQEGPFVRSGLLPMENGPRSPRSGPSPSRSIRNDWLESAHPTGLTAVSRTSSLALGPRQAVIPCPFPARFLPRRRREGEGKSTRFADEIPNLLSVTTTTTIPTGEYTEHPLLIFIHFSLLRNTPYRRQSSSTPFAPIGSEQPVQPTTLRRRNRANPIYPVQTQSAQTNTLPSAKVTMTSASSFR
ncbi:uncharacterized protein N7482_008083 [Penicillium canariense]|uniref:Uncharacterized protein n=1 Tax=Penicillium canariense TaxID=189055 RepID=A0A9W9HSH4_9EURO|nr:uncharacterized protein N7482_008083 [Penicillium canariense]KAJ5156983.1 hypothetical protein N7482_008083 [Penicillium canariense]